MLIRINIDENSLKQVAEVKNNLKSLGLFEYKNLYVYSDLIRKGMNNNCRPKIETEKHNVINSTNKQNSLRSTRKLKYLDNYEKLKISDKEVHKISCEDYGISKKIKDMLEMKGVTNIQPIHCSAQTGMFVFDPKGDIYTCWEAVGNTDFKVGSYNDKVNINPVEIGKWHERSVTTVDGCMDCKYALLCGGGCVAIAIAEGKGFNDAFCDGYSRAFQSIVPKVYKEFTSKTKEKVY